MIEWVEIIPDHDPKWDMILQNVLHDIYHTSAYHRVSGIGSNGKNFLFACGSRGHTFCWPYTLRTLEDIPGCEDTGYRDVTSIYGYSGPTVSTNASSDFIGDALKSLEEYWISQKVISAFTRFNPLISNHSVIGKCQDNSLINGGGLKHVGSTISIDLSLNSNDQVKQYQKVLRQDIRKLRERGLTVIHDDSWKTADDFIEFYCSTMTRRDASSEYFVDRAWLDLFRDALQDRCHLFYVDFEGQTIASLLAIESNGLIHAHLTGINNNFLHLSPLKILLDGIRDWSTEQGHQSFHLGGGIGGKEDSLYAFKRKFSPKSSSFIIGRWIINADAYSDAHRRVHGFNNNFTDGYFPSYRNISSTALMNEHENELVKEFAV